MVFILRGLSQPIWRAYDTAVLLQVGRRAVDEEFNLPEPASTTYL